MDSILDNFVKVWAEHDCLAVSAPEGMYDSELFGSAKQPDRYYLGRDAIAYKIDGKNAFGHPLEVKIPSPATNTYKVKPVAERRNNVIVVYDEKQLPIICDLLREMGGNVVIWSGRVQGVSETIVYLE